ncbi:MAG: DUF935 family protein [Roseateles sp.]|uniref:DUF935 domain-containing protein n=1 Tax=Roseateles sp. TaxID=1971397 RepID=UPI0039E9FB4E
MATRRLKAAGAEASAPAVPELNSEFAHRLRDPFEQLFMGVIQPNDPLLIERGAGPEIYRDLKRDGKVFDGLQKRQLALVGKPWRVEPVTESAKGTQDAETVTGILKAASFDRLCMELLEALIGGFAPAEVVWTVRGGMVVPGRVVKRAQRRFKFVQVDEISPPRLHLLTRENMVTGIPVPERKFIVHRVNAEDDNPYGTGLGLQLYWPVFFKRKAVVSWNQLNDRVGSPTLHGEYPRNASKKEKDTLADALRAFRSDGFVMTPEGMKVALVESKLQGDTTLQQALCEYMDDWIAAVLTGQEARSKGGGALAAASKERADVREDLTQADADLLSETLNSTLLTWICELNGLEPCHVWRQVKQEDDLKASAETDKVVSDMGFELSLDAVRAKYGEGWEKKEEPAPPVPPVPQSGGVPPAAGAAPDRRPASFAERPAAQVQRDALDGLVDMALEDWEPALDPQVAVLQAAIDDAAARGDSAGELIARLPGLLAQMDSRALHEVLAKAAYVARLGGAAGLALDGSDAPARPAPQPAFAEAAPAAAPAPQVVVHVHPNIHVPEQPPAVVRATVQVQPTPVNVVNEVQPTPITVTNEVRPADVTVVDTHPTRAEQVVERDGNDEIVKTVTIYSREA